MSFAPVPSLVTFTPLTTILSADVNSNLSAIRTAVNGLITGSNTIAVDTITENTASAGVTVNKKFIISGPSILASGVTVSGITTFSSGFTISAGTVNASGITVSGAVTFSSGIAVTAGAATFASGWSVTGGTINVSGVTASGIVTFSSGWAISGGTINATGGVTVTGNVTFSSGITITSGAMVAMNEANTGLQRYGANQIALVASGVTCIGAEASAAFIGAGVHLKGLSVNSSYLLGFATLATSATLGFLFVGSTPGTATGTPNALGYSGVVPICYDTTNNRLQIYNGGWKTVLLA